MESDSKTGFAYMKDVKRRHYKSKILNTQRSVQKEMKTISVSLLAEETKISQIIIR